MKKETKDVNIKIRLTRSERERIIENLNGKSISEFIRIAIKEYLDGASPECHNILTTKNS